MAAILTIVSTRVIGGAVALLTAFVGLTTSAAVQLVLLALILLAVILVSRAARAAHAAIPS